MHKKLFSSICILNLIINSLFPVFSVSAVYAQEAIPTPTDTVVPVVTPDPTVTSVPVAEVTTQPSAIPTETPTPTIGSSTDSSPSATPADTVPIPTTTEVTAVPTSTSAPSDQNNNQPSSSPTATNQPNAPPATSTSPTSTLTPSATASVNPAIQTIKGQLSTIVLKNNSTAPITLDLNPVNVNSASLTTNKADYAPTETAIITGTNFSPKTNYLLIITSSDAPAVNFSVAVVTDDKGSFIYSYQLDGNYRPNYQVEVRDNSGKVITKTTFTDSDSPASVPFSESFSSPDGNNVTGWDESESHSDHARIEHSTPRSGSLTTQHVRLREGASITRTISTTGYKNITLSYYWHGDSSAESSDHLNVAWRVGNSGAFTELANHSLNNNNWSSQVSFSLGLLAENTSIQIRFSGNSNDNQEEARVDDISVTGEAIPAPTESPSPSPTDTVSPTTTPSGSKWTICHHTESDKNPYNRIVVDDRAQGGHFDANGNPLHNGDLLLEGEQDCPGTTPSPSPSPTESPSPTPTESPSPTPTDSPSPTPTESPSPTPTESPSPTPTEEPSPTPTESPSPTPTETPVLGSISGFKWDDQNGNHEQDCNFTNDRRTCEPKLSGWHIQLFENYDGVLGEQVGEDQVTNSDGNYNFPDVKPGYYYVCEEQRTGWNQTYPLAGEDTWNFKDNGMCYSVWVGEGSFVENRNFGNRHSDPVLSITKTNNAGGMKMAQGSNVLYTITVTASQSDALNVTVTDLLPKGFYFDNDSWKVVSSDITRGTNGDITSSLSAPTYHSPGTWNLGNMSMGETLTLSYLADIDGSEQPGVYRDLAFAKANSGTGGTVLATAQNPGLVSTNFVGTSVNVVKSGDGGTKVNIENKIKGDVLGASTKVKLPKTGADSGWLILAGILLILGISATVFGIKERKNV